MEDLIRNISTKFEVEFSRADSEEISALRELGFTEKLLEFYTENMPQEAIEGEVILHDCQGILDEAEGGSPGIEMSQHGIFVFASTHCGDAFCFDTNNCDSNGNPRIVYTSHCVLDEECSKEEALAEVIPFTSSLQEFLTRFAEDDIPDHIDAVEDE